MLAGMTIPCVANDIAIAGSTTRSGTGVRRAVAGGLAVGAAGGAATSQAEATGACGGGGRAPNLGQR